VDRWVCNMRGEDGGVTTLESRRAASGEGRGARAGARGVDISGT
jgi:hypothetical protein